MTKQPKMAGVGRGLSQRFFVTGLMTVALGAFGTTRAQAAETTLSNPKVTFTASSSNGTKIVGVGTQIKLEVRGPWLIFKVPLSAMTTHLAARDRQMRDRYLEADTHPAVELRIARDGLSVPKVDGMNEGNANAKLILHGKARDTIVHYMLERKGDSVKVHSSFRVDLHAHGIDIPNYRGITVRPEIDVEVAFGSVDRAVVAERD